MFSATMRLDEETVDKERREQFVDSILVVRARNIQIQYTCPLFGA